MSISMAMDKPKTPPRKTKTSLFPFGFSKKAPLDKPFEAQVSDTQKRKRWFSWPRFRMKPSAIKTVPLVQHSSEKKTTSHCKYNKFTKSKSKLKPDKSTQLSIHRQSTPATLFPPLSHLPGVQDLPTAPQKDGHEDTNLGNVEKLDNSDARVDDTCPPKRLPSGRTNDTVKTALSRTSSTSNRSSTVSSLRPAASLTISNAVSVSAPAPGRLAGNESSLQSHVMLRKSPNGLAKSKKKRKDPGGVGISIIIMAILMMVILCGRLYAILCTSAWFYFLPRLRMAENGVGAKEEEEDSSSSSSSSTQLKNCTKYLDLDSKDYKKKVILEGLLERNHRILRNAIKD